MMDFSTWSRTRFVSNLNTHTRQFKVHDRIQLALDLMSKASQVLDTKTRMGYCKDLPKDQSLSLSMLLHGVLILEES